MEIIFQLNQPVDYQRNCTVLLCWVIIDGMAHV